MRTLALALLALHFLAFVGIDLAGASGALGEFPPFLFFENLVYALAALGLAYGLLKGKDVWGLVVLYGAFLAGRVSRSVITPFGTFPELAAEHVPLVGMSLLLALVGLYQCYRR
ncbi:MAG: hypothetical protein GXO07_01175 [Crenarchaeota archaeon]|nr:hypothetical protein [Thermoproteota archaeon]